jgi:hypothetical protein
MMSNAAVGKPYIRSHHPPLLADHSSCFAASGFSTNGKEPMYGPESLISERVQPRRVPII